MSACTAKAWGDAVAVSGVIFFPLPGQHIDHAIEEFQSLVSGCERQGYLGTFQCRRNLVLCRGAEPTDQFVAVHLLTIARGKGCR